MIINSVVIGTGVGLKHIRALNQISGSKVLAICEQDKLKHNDLKKKFKKVIILSNYQQILKLKQKIDLISVASYDSAHFKQIKLLSNVCKNFIVEKPLVTTPSELIKLRNIVKNKKIKIFSNLVLREVRMFKYIKKIINKKNVYNIEADYLWGRLHKLFEWRSKEKNYSLTLGASIHMIDIINWLVDDLPVSVFTKGNKILTKNSKFKKFSFLTHLLQFKNGLIVKISANAGSIHPHFHEIKIFQNNKTFISNISNQLLITKNKNKFKINKLKARYPDKKNREQLIKSFVQAIKKNTDTEPSFNYLCNLMQICFAADQSLKNKMEIKIKYFRK